MAKIKKGKGRSSKGRDESTQMAKLIIAELKDNGQYRYRQKMVKRSNVQDELKAAREKR